MLVLLNRAGSPPVQQDVFAPVIMQ